MSLPSSPWRKAWFLACCLVCLLMPSAMGRLNAAPVLSASLPAPAGEGYSIRGESSLSGVFTLTVFDGDSTFHTFTDKASGGMFHFSGQVAGPVLASLQHSSVGGPLYFYLENSEISIVFNASHPEQSVVRNSRSNSEYRYLMERYRAAADPGVFLVQYAREQPSSPYLPFVVHQQMGSLDDGVVRQLVSQMAEAGHHSYHFTLLRRWMRSTPAVSEGSEMPDFAYLDGNKERRTFAQTRNPQGPTLILFGATWCGSCQTQLQQAQKAIGTLPVSILNINIDDNPNGWDAHYLRQLSIDHIPYFILVDSRGWVLARDIRIWELDRVLRTLR